MIVEEMNPQFLQERTKAVLDFDAMQVRGDFKIGDGIGAEEDLVMPADVEEFDGEDVGGVLEFLLGEELRRRFSQLAGPPMNDVREASKVGGFRGFEDAEQVEIGL